MLRTVFAAALIVAAPLAAFAQTNTSTGSTAGISSAARPGPTGNQNDPQLETNQAGQPGLARTTPGSGNATAIPTPTLSGHMTAVPQSPGPTDKR